MTPVNRLDAMRASLTYAPHQEHANNEDAFELGEFEAELKRLSAANQELMEQFPATAAEPAVVADDVDEVTLLRHVNDELRARIEELETALAAANEGGWQERQREYEMLLEEKSEVIRNLHLKMQEMQESAISTEVPSAPVGNNPPASGTRLGQAEEILRLKRELEAQRRQLEQDEQDMMAQMRQMEISMAKERAEMARQRQEVTRQQADLTREIENSARAPELRERLNTLRRGDSKQVPVPAPAPPSAPAEEPKSQKSSGFFRRMFG